MKTLNVDMYQTLAAAVGVLYLGGFLKKKIKFLETFCIPAPVVGGIVFALLSCLLHGLGIVEFQFDETLKTVCMVMFFTSVGFQANLKVLKAGGKSLVVFLLCLVVLIFTQNFVAVGISKLLGISPLVGMCTGSIPMVGGHGTSGAFGTVLEDFGIKGATTVCTAAATFGLIIGSTMGGPIGRRLILKHDLLKTAVAEDPSILEEDEQKHHRSVSMYAPAAYQLAIAMGIGTVLSWLLSMTGMTFPIYIGSMIAAAFMRNIGEYGGKIHIHMGEINDIGGICLSLFLGIAMITLQLWQLAELALPMIILLLAQVVLMAMFSYFLVYNVMGRDYDAAVLAAGTCGFGMGATPNAMANMQALTEKFVPSIKAYMLVPIVGSMFADFINSLVITAFINFIN
ncbi:sodium/glutamate symporter [Ruminococcus sp. CAG:579]|nr:sodium/glutamate symporter [Ruminococcus sp. CAG:579]